MIGRIFTLTLFHPESVILCVRTDEPHVNHPVRVIDPNDQSILVAGDIEHDPSVPEESDVDPWLWSVTVLTTSATDDVGRIHDRMPLMVERDRWAAWLDPTVSERDDLLSLLVPAAPGRLEAFPVSTDVNNVRNNGPELVEPIPAEDALS